MFLRLLALFTIIPIIELYLLIKIGEEIGALSTIIIILITGMLGAALAKKEGLQVYHNFRNALNEARMPGDELLHGLFVLVGGATLLTPGILTDLAGLSMLLPPVRSFYVSKIKKYLRKKVQKQ